MSSRRRPAPGHRALALVAALASGLALALVAGSAAAGSAAAAPGAAPLPAAAVPAAPAPLPAAGEPGALPVTVTLTSVGPVALTPSSLLTVSGAIHNTGSETLTGLRINLRLAWQPITDRRELAAWASLPSQDERVGTLWEKVLLPGPLLPGGTVPFVITGRGDAVGLPVTAEAFGPRGMSVEVQDQVGAGLRRVGIVRTFTVWSPVPQTAPTRLSILVPITSGSSPVETGRIDPSLAAQWRPDGRLNRVLAAAADPAFSYALDPALLAAGKAAQTPTVPVSATPSTLTASSLAPSSPTPSARPTLPGRGPASGAAPSGAAPSGAGASGAGASTGSGPGSSPAAASTGLDPRVAADAAAWTTQLVAARAGRDVLTLPYGDPDVAALAAGGYGDLLDLADRAAASVTAATFGSPLPDGLVWPVTGRTDPTAAGLAARPPGRTLVLSTAGVPVAAPGGSAQAHVRLSVPGGDADAILTDDALSAALGATGGPDPALAIQRLLAETAAITAAHPGRTGTALATVPRTWNPDPTSVAAAVTALHSADWVQLGGLAAVRDQAPVTVPRSKLARAPEAGAKRGLPTDHVNTVAHQLRAVQAFAPALTPDDPGDAGAAAAAAAVIDPIRQQGLQLLSVAWIGARPAPLATAQAALRSQVDQLYGGISIVAGSSANLLASSGLLPVTVVNKLPVPVQVRLTLHPTSARIQVSDPVMVQLDAGRSTTVRMRIRAVANGDVRIESSLSAPVAGGATLTPEPATIMVRVRREWEGRGLFWIGVALLVLLVAGLVRSARRPRVRISPDAVPDPDDVGRDLPPAPLRPPATPLPGSAATGARSVTVGPDGAAVARPAGLGVQPAESGPPGTRSGPTSDPATGSGTGSGGSVALAARPARPGVVIERLDPDRLDLDRAGPAPARSAQPQSWPDLGSDLGAEVAAEVGTVPLPSSGPAAPAGPPAEEGAGASGGTGSGGTDGGSDAHDAGTGVTGGGGRGTTRLLSSSAIMAAGTLASRVLGVVRVVVLGWAIGLRGPSADIFSTANTLPNSLMILLAGGVLNAVLVPQIVRAARHQDGGKDYLDRLLTLAITLLGAATVISVALAPLLVRLFGSSRWTPAQLDLGTAFALWCLPQIFFYGLYTIYGQVLNARGSFGPYMWAPVANNLVAIAGTLVFVAVSGPGRKPAEWWGAGPVALLAGTATLGIVVQALVLVPVLRRSGYSWRPTWGFRGIGLSTAGRIAGWTFAAAAVGQLGFVFISQAANSGGARGSAAGADTAGRAVYDNAYLLFILPHSLIAVSIVTAVFTRMSISASAGRTSEVRADTSLAVRLTGVATVLATVAVLVLGRDLTYSVFFFNSRAETDSLALATASMILGVVPFSAQYLFSRIFYAYEDARTPFLIQLLTVAIWAGGSLLAAAVLPPAWVVPGTGLAMSAANLVGAAVSVLVLRGRIGGLDGARVLRTHVRLVVAAVLAGVVGWFVSAAVHGAAGTGRTSAYLALAIGGSAMLAGYAVALRVMKVEEFGLLADPLADRLRRRSRPAGSETRNKV